ncbi:N-acetyltransferase [Pigmentiphaga sp. NML080357]|jgi:aminoglycoside 6'-N-acetyltransferase I|uniref:aminoglycoside 6'-N-acetyltransferase n=1 Tax=Pigmentiphaga sp. NML080357 TaxID=2008675 RepID=UPI000B421AFA|nr:aminoglycoside 6'-N-acetyltransferase [Pigmentiphaga sp. NML080357]OVZ55502.1 N-acetyltransferase [Pigmentiphaga sp. NML080357]
MKNDACSIERCGPADIDEWARMRDALWPGDTLASHREELEAMLAGAGTEVAWIARDDQGRAVGFAEASLRHDYVNGCTSTPVGFLEGIYVVPDRRRQGIARRLCGAAEDWARSMGCMEFASDAAADAIASHRMHQALGFEETERVVYFRKPLESQA